MKTPPATLTLIFALALVFAIEVVTHSTSDESRQLLLGALPNDAQLHAQYWRLVTYSFLHFNWSHLFMNLALLWWVGGIVERRVGWPRATIIFAGGVVLAALLILWVNNRHPRPGATVGASGGIFGLLAAALVLVYRPAASSFGTNRTVRIGLWICLLIGIGISFIPGVSMAGHLGGFLWGLGSGLSMRIKTPLHILPTADELDTA